mgnify:CR=1 FL=1
MSRNKYLNFEEARKSKKLEQFAKENPLQSKGNRFERLLNAMSRGLLEDGRTSSQDASEGYSGTQTRRDTSEDAS